MHWVLCCSSINLRPRGVWQSSNLFLFIDLVAHVLKVVTHAGHTVFLICTTQSALVVYFYINSFATLKHHAVGVDFNIKTLSEV